MTHRNRHWVTLQVYSSAQFLGLGRGFERTRIVTTIRVHIAVAWMKPLKNLVNPLNQLRRYSVLTVIHVLLLSLNFGNHPKHVEFDVPEAAL
jgi:hypothetical protein